MRCVQMPAQHPVQALRTLSSAHPAVQRAVNVMMASYSMDIRVSERLSVAAMTMEEHTRYCTNQHLQEKAMHGLQCATDKLVMVSLVKYK